MQRNGKQEFLAGVRTAIPIVLGYIPIGIAYAIMARQAGLSVGQTVLMSLTVYAGAAQMMAVGMIGQGAGILAIVLATFILNLRHLIMSVCVMNRLRGVPTGPKLLAAYGITDESFAIFTTAREEHCNLPFFAGLSLSIYISWSLGGLLGALAMDLLPEMVMASLGIAIYAMFISLLLPSLPGNWRLGALVLLTAVCNILLNQVMASSWALIVSTLVCAFAGVFFVELKEESRDE